MTTETSEHSSLGGLEPIRWHSAVGRVHFKIFKTYKHGEYFGCAIELREFIGIKNNEPEYNRAKMDYVIKNYDGRSPEPTANEAEDNIIEILRNIITANLTIRNRCGCNHYWHCWYCKFKKQLQWRIDNGYDPGHWMMKADMLTKFVSEDLIKEVLG